MSVDMSDDIPTGDDNHPIKTINPIFEDENIPTGKDNRPIDPLSFFVSKLPLDTKLNSGGVSIRGHPGIGKTVDLDIILILCLLVGRPTLWTTGNNTLLIFNKKGVYRLPIDDLSSPYATELLDEVPDAWVLVDCNAKMTGVPSEIYGWFKFIVQAAPPLQGCFEWLKKITYPVLPWVMKPFDREELLLSGTLYEPELDPHRLIHYFESYGPCARQAHQYARYPDDARLRQQICGQARKCVDRCSFSNLFTSTALLSLAPEFHELSSTILLIRPGEYRGDHEIVFATDYVLSLVTHAHKDGVAKVSAMIYKACSSVFSSSLVGQVFGAMVHACLPLGGVFKVTRLESSGDENATNKIYCSRPQQMRISACGVFLESNGADSETRLAPIKEEWFDENNPPDFEQARYYRPKSKNYAAFDSLIFDPANNVVTAFQITSNPNYKINGSAARRDPVLPRRVFGHGRCDGLERVESTDAHLMDNKNGWEGFMAISDVKRDRFAMETLQKEVFRVVYEHKLASLRPMNIWYEENMWNKTHLG
ncbi:hypothetical protein BV25DRAFT_375378 [Artomyces pyxidatus]|uniref:Uncharacterized protein n=1 Tax=Artomyces pyxidatus TaxID=48021 RepID=A0ACB8SF58_9AGAM|nr:hypothetical protein BV25DRAFT_375378 [Artomyces pyxidatus]